MPAGVSWFHMKQPILAPFIAVLMGALLACPAAFGQAGAAGKAAPKGPHPGVAPKRIMERPEVRVGRVTIQPGATRSIHKHDEFRFQLFVPLTGKMEVTIGGKTQEAVIGEAYFIDRSEPHGFKNTGTEVSTALEIFIKDPNAKAMAVELGKELAKLP